MLPLELQIQPGGLQGDPVAHQRPDFRRTGLRPPPIPVANDPGGRLRDRFRAGPLREERAVDLHLGVAVAGRALSQRAQCLELGAGLLLEIRRIRLGVLLAHVRDPQQVAHAALDVAAGVVEVLGDGDEVLLVRLHDDLLNLRAELGQPPVDLLQLGGDLRDLSCDPILDAELAEHPAHREAAEIGNGAVRQLLAEPDCEFAAGAARECPGTEAVSLTASELCDEADEEPIDLAARLTQKRRARKQRARRLQIRRERRRRGDDEEPLDRGRGPRRCPLGKRSQVRSDERRSGIDIDRRAGRMVAQRRPERSAERPAEHAAAAGDHLSAPRQPADGEEKRSIGTGANAAPPERAHASPARHDRDPRSDQRRRTVEKCPPGDLGPPRCLHSGRQARAKDRVAVPGALLSRGQVVRRSALGEHSGGDDDCERQGPAHANDLGRAWPILSAG